MPQHHQENQGVVQFDVARTREIQSTASVGANTWTGEETDSKMINHKHHSEMLQVNQVI